MEDTYNTILEPSEGNFKDRGSKFHAFAYPVYNEDQIKSIQQELRKEYYDARHHCFAWRLGADKDRYRANDDGEPSNSSGMPILGQIQSFDLSNILVVVIRYFGGTKLGIPGLINAYRTATAEAIKSAEIITKTVNDFYKVNFSYAAMNDVMKIIKDENIINTDQVFELECSLIINVRKKEITDIISKLKKINSVKLEYLKTE